MPTFLATMSTRYTPGAVDETAFAAAVQRLAARHRGNRDRRGTRSIWAGRTDAELEQAALDYLSSYRHQFRVLVPADRVST